MANRNRKWTKEKLTLEARLYTEKKHFERGSYSAYMSAYNAGWLDEICAHMPRRREIWTSERVREEASKYSTKIEFLTENSKAYKAAVQRNILDDVCRHMDLRAWTVEDCRLEALKYSTKEDFRKNSGGAYCAARRAKIIQKICGHMKHVKYANGYWTLERAVNAAKNFSSRAAFAKACPGGYKVVMNAKQLDAVCSGMKRSISDTIPERVSRTILSLVTGVPAEKQRTLKYPSGREMEFDAYLEVENETIVLEYQGPGHYLKSMYGEASLRNTQKRDRLKKTEADRRGWVYIAIPCLSDANEIADFIYNSLPRHIPRRVTYSQLDWNKLTKIVCNKDFQCRSGDDISTLISVTSKGEYVEE